MIKIKPLISSLLIILIIVLTVMFFLNRQSTSIVNSKIPEDIRRITIEQEGETREYLVYIPSVVSDNPSIVIALHGGGGPLGSAELMAKKSGWTELAENDGFLAVFPQGTLDDSDRNFDLNNGLSRNIRTWSDGSNVTESSKRNVNDVAFIKTVIEDVEKRFKIGDANIYVTGFSNGATMAYYLGVELAGEIKAIAPVAGLLYSHKKLDAPVSLLSILGDRDPAPKNSSFIPRAYAASYIQNAAQVWREYIGCPEKGKIERDNNITIYRFEPCLENSRVVSVVIGGLGHVYPGLSKEFGADPKIGDEINATETAWKFFRSLD